MLFARIAALAIGYLMGTFQTGLFYGLAHGVDIRNSGSGNTGTTNTLRTLGKKAGYIAFFGDALKALFAVLIVHFLFRNSCGDGIKLIEAYAGFGAVLGHNFPFYLKFKGGKGIACTAGMMVAVCPPAVPLCAVLFFGNLFLTGYVSLGSLLMVSAMLIQVLIFNYMGILGLTAAYALEYDLVIAAFTAMAFWRHRANIVRLMNGTESSFKKKKEND